MSLIRLGLSGAKGRMGETIKELVSAGSKFKITAEYDTQNSLDSWNPSDIDGVIDFSLPEPFNQVLSWCEAHQKPLVSGTTGISLEQKELLKKSSSLIPILWAPNMSLGVACLNEWLKQIPKEVQKWNIQITETHHTLKKDKPSGTALHLLQTLKDEGMTPQETVCHREGDVFGIHEVEFSNGEEIITLKHEALNRKIFARGALLASSWLIHQPAGLYEIQNCL